MAELVGGIKILGGQALMEIRSGFSGKTVARVVPEAEGRRLLQTENAVDFANTLLRALNWKALLRQARFEIKRSDQAVVRIEIEQPAQAFVPGLL